MTTHSFFGTAVAHGVRPERSSRAMSDGSETTSARPLITTLHPMRSLGVVGVDLEGDDGPLDRGFELRPAGGAKSDPGTFDRVVHREHFDLAVGEEREPSDAAVRPSTRGTPRR